MTKNITTVIIIKGDEKMTTTGSILWILAIGLLIYCLLFKRGAGSDEEENSNDTEHHKNEAQKQHKGGCCG